MSYNQKEHKLEERKTQKRHSLKKRLIIAGIVIVALFGGAVSAWFYISNNKASDAENVISERAALANKTAEAAQKVIADGGTVDAAAALYDSAIDSVDNNDTKNTLLLDKSVLYYNGDDLDKALTIALESETAAQNANIEQYIAGIYEQKGDNQNAIKYYQRAISLIDNSNPVANADKQSYQASIKRLGGTVN